MIIVRLGVRGVEATEILAVSDRDEDCDLAVWPLVREELDRLDARLRHEGPAILERLGVARPQAGAA